MKEEVLLLVLFFLSLFFVSAEISSESYNLIREGISSGGGLTDGEESTQTILGGVSGESSSSSYIMEIGPLYGSKLAPVISWIDPTPLNGATVNQRSVFLNTSIVDEDNVSAFFDWNRTLVGYWNFEEYNNTGIYDNSSYDNFGTFNGNLDPSRFGDGSFGHSLIFDGNGDYLATPFKTDGIVNLTFSFWINPSVLPSSSYGYVFDTSSGGGCGGRFTNVGKFEAFCYSGGNPDVVSVGSIPLDQWTHLVFVQGFNGSSIYKNGQHIASNFQDDSLGISPGANFAIGAEYSGSNAFNGSIDEVVLIKRLLSVSEINALYDNSQYGLYHNFTNLPNGIYDYSAYAIDSFGMLSKSSRYVNVSGNTPPTVSLVSPSNGNLTTDRTPTFIFDATDQEGDTLNYDINITKKGMSLCTDYGLSFIDYLSESYTPSNDLKCLYDNGDYYEWSVRACETNTPELFCSDWTTSWQVNISSLVSLVLLNDLADFGSMEIMETASTDDPGINPLAMENDGNSKINISINATNIWQSSYASSASDYFQSKVGPFVGKAKNALTNWFQLPLTGEVVIVDSLNYSDVSDDLEVGILLEVPSDEPAGGKSSSVVLKASLAEVYNAA